MNARASNAFLASLLLHGLAIAAIFLSTYFLRSDEVNTKIMELVAGTGDNYGATEAPALGNPDSTNPQPAEAAAPPAAPRELEAVAVPKNETIPAAPKTPNFTQQMQRVEKRTMAKIEKAEKAKAEAEEKAEAERLKQEMAAAKANHMTKEEFDRKFGKPASAGHSNSDAPVKVAKIDSEGIAEGVLGGSKANKKGGAGGTAMTREEGDVLDAYFSMLYQRLKDAHEKPSGVSDLLNALAEYDISHDGTISHVHIVRSSGSPEFDQSVLSAFRNIAPMPERPDHAGTLTRKVLFRMRDE